MALVIPLSPHLNSLRFSLSQSNCSRFSRRRPPFRISLPISSSTTSMDSHSSSELMEFPYASPPVRSLMVDLVSTVETRLSPHLLPCTLPPDVQRYQNPSGSAVASLLVRSGTPSSPVDFMLGSWLHCKLPTGNALNITSLSCYLNNLVDTPHFLMEIIQSSPTSMVFILDLVPRRDLVLHPKYLQSLYEETQLEKQRQLLYTYPEVQPYFSSSLYVRSAVSPTSILVRIEAKDEDGGDGSRLDEIVEGGIGPVAKQVLAVWLDCFAEGKRRVMDDEDGKRLKERDQAFKRKTIEIDLTSNLPRMFGKETADRVLQVLGDIFN
ncbi:hypothetical protein V2J09_016322 [Rumex salicifolius]